MFLKFALTRCHDYSLFSILYSSCIHNTANDTEPTTKQKPRAYSSTVASAAAIADAEGCWRWRFRGLMKVVFMHQYLMCTRQQGCSCPWGEAFFLSCLKVAFDSFQRQSDLISDWSGKARLSIWLNSLDSCGSAAGILIALVSPISNKCFSASKYDAFQSKRCNIEMNQIGWSIGSTPLFLADWTRVTETQLNCLLIDSIELISALVDCSDSVESRLKCYSKQIS